MERKNVPCFGVLVPQPPSKPPQSKPTTLKHNFPVKQHPVKDQRDLYSEAISAGSFQALTVGSKIPENTQDTSILQLKDHKTTIYASKVQLPYKTVPGQIPRKLQIERCRREFLKFDIEQLLLEKGIDSHHLIIGSNDPADKAQKAVSPYLPLEIFDNEEYDCHTSDGWLALCKADEKPFHGKALLPTENCIPSGNQKNSSLEYSWHKVAVLDFSKEKCQYLVQKVDQNTHWAGINNNEAATKYWVPRIRLLFMAENPHVFVERIQFALHLRDNTEALIFYNLSVSCMPIWSQAASLDTDWIECIRRKILSTPRLGLKNLERCLGNWEKEVKLEYDRTMNRLIFDQVVKSQPEDFSHITLPQWEEYVPQKGSISVPYYDFKKNQAAFAFSCMLGVPEVVCVLSVLSVECNKVATMKLFNVTSMKPLHLDKFEAMQFQVQTQMNLFLKDTWINTLSNSIRSKLGRLGRGSYNVNESSWEMYKFSRLPRLMAVVRFKMQDSLRLLIQDSLASLSQLLLDACFSVLTCPQDLVWGNNLNHSPYKPKKNPVFLVDLVLDQTGVHYSTPLEDFETSIINLFDKGILATHDVPGVETHVMTNLLFGDDLLLESVGLWEPEVTEMREKVRSALIKAVIPLRAYAAEYEKHLELHNLDIELYLKSNMSAELTSQMVREEAGLHLKDKEMIELSLPTSIIIGPFTVRVEAVRQALSNKKKALAKAVLEHFLKKLRKQVDDACEECNIISRKLREKPNSIEELTEKREWMKQIPGMLKNCKELIGKVLTDYDVFEEFFYSLPNDDFNKKWTAIAWPQRIISQVEATGVRNAEDEERFQKIQLADQENFLEHLASLEMLVAGFANYCATDRAHELANQMRRTSKQLKECQTLAQTYNNREQLFGIPVTNYDRLHKLVKDFQPFKDLWTTTSDWLRWHESWHSDPLSTIDPEQLEHHVTEAHKAMQKCIKQFKDIPNCEMVATLISGKIEDFLPYIPLIQALRSPGMKNHHWKMLSERIQIKVKPKANLTFSHCLDLGLQNYVDDIVHVGEMAGKEYAIEQALEKMEQDWSTVLFDVLPYKETGTYILKSLDEASQLLDDHIVMTQSLSSSPFNKTFEAKINTWERKLRVTRDVLEEWLTCQQSWLYLEPIFSSDDINQQLPVEGKTYQTIEQNWRGIMKSAFDNPKVIELCSDPGLLVKLKECNSKLEQMQKGLSEYLETK